MRVSSLPNMMPTPVPVNSSSNPILPSGRPALVAHLGGGPVAQDLMGRWFFQNLKQAPSSLRNLPEAVAGLQYEPY